MKDTVPLPAVTSARERILDTASRLFYQEGLRATGIDRIIEEAGVAKMSFYRHFPSKDDLIVAFLQKRHDEWMAWFTHEVEARISSQGSFEVIADVLALWFQQKEYRGCAFINAFAETGMVLDSKVALVAVEHKNALADFLVALADRLKIPQPDWVAAEAMVVIEGMIVRYQMKPDNQIIAVGKKLLQTYRSTGSNN